MYMKVFPHGQGAGEGPTNYLVREDYPGRDAHLPDVLRGDPEVTRALIDSLDTAWRFTAGALSWHPDDTVTTEQEQRVMDDFEALAFAGLEADQRNIFWVRHVHAGHHELHFVIPRVELSSGKAFNPCPPGWQKHFDLFRDLHNHREGWARPDDPARTRMFTPAHADLHRARLLRWGKTPKPDDRAAAKEASYTLFAAQRTLDDARDDFKDTAEANMYSTGKYQYVAAQHQWQAAQYTYNAAVQSFETSFRTLYLQVKDYQQVLQAAKTALATEQDNFAAAQKKHDLGNLSDNALADAQDKVSEAQDKVDGAAIDLFSAYNNYRWAVDHGILN